LHAIALDEKALGPESSELGTDLNNLGLLYVFTKRYGEAQQTYQRALAIRIKALGDTDPAVAETMNGNAAALRGLHRDAEAKQMDGRAAEITNRK
jgi:tetratricopeptide (TPR) repeat protein